MLRWRLLLGTLLIGALVGLCWLDHRAGLQSAAARGAWLLPVAILVTVLASGEVLRLVGTAGMRPLAWAVHVGNLLILATNWLPMICIRGGDSSSATAGGLWPLFALVFGLLLLFVGEMRRYEKPGGVTANLASGAFALVYVGGLLSFVVQLRIEWGVAALASLVIVTKMGDTGAYTIGRLFGRHKMAPVLSPGKTVEGALGAVAFACAGACFAGLWLVPTMCGETWNVGPWWGWVLFGAVVGLAGLLGDLAESLLKRDVGCKDSSEWMPGFGGVLDILDSILLSAPIAWLFWKLELLGSKIPS